MVVGPCVVFFKNVVSEGTMKSSQFPIGLVALDINHEAERAGLAALTAAAALVHEKDFTIALLAVLAQHVAQSVLSD